MDLGRSLVKNWADFDQHWSKVYWITRKFEIEAVTSSKITSGWSKNGSQMIPNQLHDPMIGPKTTPTCSQGGSRGPQQGSKGAQDDPVWRQQDPKLGQHESQTWQNCITLRKNANMKTIKILRGFTAKLQLGKPRWSQYGASWQGTRIAAGAYSPGLTAFC